MTVIIDEKRCPQNHPCPAIGACPHKALSQKYFDAPKVDQAKCHECGACVKFCPMHSIQFE